MSRTKKNALTSTINKFGEARAAYEMSRPSRFNRQRKDLPSGGNSGDWHYRVEEDYYRDIEKARDMDRNDQIVGQTVTRAVDNIVQDGFTLDPLTGDKGLDTEMYNRWQEYADDAEQVDIQGEFTWHDYERLSCRSMLVDGDHVVFGTETGALQSIEAHEVRCETRNNMIVRGVEKDEHGKRINYYVIEDPIDPQRGTKKKSVPYAVRDEDGVRQLFHVYNVKRMSETRGVTAFAPIFITAGMRDDIDFAKLVQQQVASCFALFRQRTAGTTAPPHTPGYGASSSKQSSEGEIRYLEDIQPGIEVIGAPGETLQGFSPDVPGDGYQFQFKTMLQMIGVNLGLPLCLVLMDGSETNFSGWRGAVDEARKGFRSNQRNLIKRLHSPVYRWRVTKWVNEDKELARWAAKPKIQILGHRWNAPVWQYIDPVGDAQGDQIRLVNSLISPRRLHAERGREWETIADEIVEDLVYAVVKAKRAAMAINKKFDDGAPVHWRELINLPMPTGMQMSFQDPNKQAADAAKLIAGGNSTLTQQNT